jgi:hypothetical protein
MSKMDPKKLMRHSLSVTGTDTKKTPFGKFSSGPLADLFLTIGGSSPVVHSLEQMVF